VEESAVSRGIAALLLLLTIALVPSDARAPRPLAGWDLFAAEALLGALPPAATAALDSLDVASGPPRSPAATPEPAAALLAALGLTALALGRSRRPRR